VHNRRGYISGWTGENTTASGKKIICMAKERISGKMAESMKV
jgi:hypothetical protein